MISVAEAQTHLAALFAPVETEVVKLEDAHGRVLRETVTAQRNQPPFAASAMDGYAVRASDLRDGAHLEVIGEIAAGHDLDLTIGPGQAARIFTGAPLPDGADHILIQEDAVRAGNMITVSEGRDTAPYVRPAGTDFKAGFALDAPRALRSTDLALLASMGAGRVTVSRKPVVAIIATGDELVWPGAAPRADQIMASNSFGLKAMLETEGASARLLPIAKDRTQSLLSAFEMATGADLIVTMGGASVGDHDLVQEAGLASGLSLDFYKIAMRPGKPLMAGRLGQCPMVGLPGNPVSALVCGHLFLRPAVRAMLGLGYVPAPKHSAALSRDIAANGPREHYMRAHVELDGRGWVCTPFERQDSSLLSVLADANALMIRPAGQQALNAGDVVEFTHL